jgi:hypothetical protein
MNREMLKECIADAKTIRETAIASAKVALEEAFTPTLMASFAEQLNELELEEAETEKELEEMYSNEESELEETFNLEELLAELSMEEGDEASMEKEGMDGEQLDEELMLEEMSDEEIEELITQVIDDMIASGKLMAGEESEEGEEDMEDMDDMEDMGDMEDMESEEEINLDELLAEMEGNKEESVTEAGDAMSQFIDYVTSGNMEAAGNVVGAALQTAAAGKIAGGLGVTGSVIAFFKALKSYLKDSKAEKGNMEETADATEMEETIAELRNELNEVNLLNAKLLYTNKIFKAKNLTESEKIKVLNTFDKAESVKEVKLVFETLTESLKATTAKKNTIKESLGSASKTISTATPKQPIIEVNEAFARMQRLAGLKK